MFYLLLEEMVLFYDIQGSLYFKQVNKLFFGAWKELIFFTLFIMGKNDSVFEQLSRTNCVRKPRFDCIFKNAKQVTKTCWPCAGPSQFIT